MQFERDQHEVDRLGHPNMYEEHERKLQQIEKQKAQLQSKLTSLSSDVQAIQTDYQQQKSAKEALEEALQIEQPNEIG